MIAPVLAVLIGPAIPDAYWQYKFVATPAYGEASKLDAPGFIKPVERNTPMPGKLPCEARGEFWVLIKDDGSVKWLGSLERPFAGTPCQKRHVEAVVNGWRFEPARYKGAATPVMMRLIVDQQ